MNNVFAVARRVLMQFRHDPRTIGIMVIAPCIALWLFSVLLGAGDYAPRIATIDVPDKIESALHEQNTRIIETKDNEEAARLLEDNELDAILTYHDQTLFIEVEGADVSKTGSTLKEVQAAIVEVQKDASKEVEELLENTSIELPEEVISSLPENVGQRVSEAINEQGLSLPDFTELLPVTSFEVEYLHGNDSWTSFDFFGPVFIGIFIFVFVFLTCSMSLLTERSGGTVTRLMVTPIRGWQIVGGYVLGFGLITLIQSAIILWACIYLIGFPNEGSLFLVGFITLSMAMVSLTFGLLISGLAHTPFQVIQLMIVFIIPQILLSGIFDLSQTPDWMQAIAAVFPIYYGADALRDVMLRGADLADVATNIAILWGFIAAFFLLACLNFRKKRAKTLPASSPQ